MARRRDEEEFEEQEEFEEEDYEEGDEDEDEEDEEFDNNLIAKIKNKWLRKLDALDPNSEEAKELLKSINSLTQSEANQSVTIANKKNERRAQREEKLRKKHENDSYISAGISGLVNGVFGIVTTGIHEFANSRNMKSVIKCEDDGGIVASKGFNFIRKG